jgi:hypothetical protein
LSIYRGAGGAGDAVADSSSEALLIRELAIEVQADVDAAAGSATSASGSASAAATSATNASNSATAAATSATNASNSASAASTSATNAANSATAAQTAETAAELAETNAETAETNAAASASVASSSASAASTSATNASNSATAAATSATNSANSATASATSATNASNSATAAAGSATTASTQATNAANSATAAASSATAAAGSATAAATSATAAQTAETNAETAETNAETAQAAAEAAQLAAETAQAAAELAETNAETAETNAETSETNAAASASAASGSASAAATSATNSSNSASAASTSATNAANSASAASTSASNAATSESNAAASATSASGSATTATTQAGIATTQASNASTSASNAATSASSAASAQSAAETARDQTLAAFDSFDDRYLGQKSTAPTLDNDGDPLVAGALYFNTTTNEMKVWDGTQWLNAYASLSGALISANNLSDLQSTSTARTNLGLAIGTNVQAWDADLDTWATKTAPSGTVVGTSDTQTLTNKTLTSPVVTGGSINNTPIGATTASTGSFTSLTDSGNLTFTGTGNRILGDFSNATATSRVSFQTSTTNSNTVVQAIPNGTGTIALFDVYNNSDPTNAANCRVRISSTEAQLSTGISGTGTYLPLTMHTGGSERVRVFTSGGVSIGNTTDPGATNLSVTGTIAGNGSLLTALNASNIASGTIANARTTATSSNTANTLVARDASGNFVAGTITASLSGTATTATNWGAYGAVPAAGASFATANTIARSDSNGYVYTGYISSNTANSENPATVGQVIVTNGSDNFYRKASIAHLTGRLSGTAPISITGNAATATNAASINGTNTVFGISASGQNTGLVGKAGPEITGNGGGGAVWSMHRPGAFGLNMGLDSDNVFRIGGWSAAANRLQMDMSGNLTMAGNVGGGSLSTTGNSTINGREFINNTSGVYSTGARVEVLYQGNIQFGSNWKTTTADGIAHNFVNSGGGQVGYIYTNSSSTSYVTSSDYRLKENVAPMVGALDKVLQLKPVTYSWKADGSSGQGFIAHELQEVVPECVTGKKDGVEIVDELDEAGEKIGTKEVPKYQGIDTSFLVATLTAAIQELKSDLDSTKTLLANAISTVDAQALRIVALENHSVESQGDE